MAFHYGLSPVSGFQVSIFKWPCMLLVITVGRLFSLHLRGGLILSFAAIQLPPSTILHLFSSPLHPFPVLFHYSLFASCEVIASRRSHHVHADRDHFSLSI